MLFKAVRFHQWSKNLLVFVPPLIAHRINDLALTGQTDLTFLSFGLYASSVCLLNDLVNLEDDRKYLSKHTGLLPVKPCR